MLVLTLQLRGNPLSSSLSLSFCNLRSLINAVGYKYITKVYSEINGTLFRKCSHLPDTGLNSINVVSLESYIKALHNGVENLKKNSNRKEKNEKEN